MRWSIAFCSLPGNIAAYNFLCSICKAASHSPRGYSTLAYISHCEYQSARQVSHDASIARDPLGQHSNSTYIHPHYPSSALLGVRNIRPSAGSRHQRMCPKCTSVVPADFCLALGSETFSVRTRFPGGFRTLSLSSAAAYLDTLRFRLDSSTVRSHIRGLRSTYSITCPTSVILGSEHKYYSKTTSSRVVHSSFFSFRVDTNAEWKGDTVIFTGQTAAFERPLYFPTTRQFLKTERLGVFDRLFLNL